MSGLNENHQRSLRSIFHHIDELLDEGVRLLDPAQSQSPFSDIVCNGTQAQQGVIADYTARVRSAMGRMLIEQGIRLPAPSVPAVWTCRTLLASAQVTIEEMRAPHLRGGGEIGQEAAAELDAMAGELADLIRRMEDYLAGEADSVAGPPVWGPRGDPSK
jgi:hypothetical protein